MALLAAVGVLGAAAAGVVVSRSGDGRVATGSGGATVHTVEVQRADLSDTVSEPGTLGFGTAQQIRGGDGKVTWLPAAGATVARGRPLFRVDDQPVVLFYGGTPLFRQLDAPGLVGRDVKTVADNLKALGYSIGSQPSAGAVIRQPADSGGGEAVLPDAVPTPQASDSAGTAAPPTTPVPRTTSVTVRTGDGVLTQSLMNAVKRWQGQVGMPQTGVLGADDVVVLPYEVRVGSVSAQLGTDAASPLMSVTATRKVVTVTVDALDAGSIRAAQSATVSLPNGTTTQGTVAAVGTTAADPSGAGDSGDPPQVTVTVVLDHPDAVSRLDASPVQVGFVGQVKKGVLAVPVGTLLALSGGGYGVQTPDGRLIAVTTGLFAKGLVEISGSGIAQGLKLVTTS